MNYSLHPEASEDLRDAASFYRDQAGTSLSQFFGDEIRVLAVAHHSRPSYRTARRWSLN